MRYAICFTPAASDPLSHVAANWLGRNVFSGEMVEPTAIRGLSIHEIAFHTALPRRYGFQGVLKAPFRLAFRGFLAIELRDRGVAVRAQRCVAIQIGRGLRKIGRCRAQFRFSAFHLQLDVARIKPCRNIAGSHAIAHVDRAVDDFAGNAEAEIDLMARTYHADELARRTLIRKTDALDLHRSIALDRGCGADFATGK